LFFIDVVMAQPEHVILHGLLFDINCYETSFGNQIKRTVGKLNKVSETNH